MRSDRHQTTSGAITRTLHATCLLIAVLHVPTTVRAEPTLLSRHCSNCHDDESAEGEFRLSALGSEPNEESLGKWFDVLDRVRAGEMPPEDGEALTADQRRDLLDFVRSRVVTYRDATGTRRTVAPRRMNNREFRNSVRDVLMIEDVGTHQPTDDLVGDSLFEGFDTHGETLGFSEFHLEQYIEAIRRIVDATILTGDRPESRRYVVGPTDIVAAHTSQNTTRPERYGRPEGFDFLDPKSLAFLANFETAPATGHYEITIRCTGLDRGKYDAVDTGIHDADPIRLAVRLGDRVSVHELPDDEIHEIHLKEWIAAGSRLRFQFPTDGLRLRGNGNFKFQNAITGQYLKEHEPQRYAQIVAGLKPKKSGQARSPADWHNWVDYWMGPRPRIHGVVVEGPFYESWPPRRQVALIGENPSVENAARILEPIAERAWRRAVRPGELDDIVQFVESRAERLGTVGALKEGIVSVLVSPRFLLLNREDLDREERFASKLAGLLGSTIPDARLRLAAADGELDSFEGVRAEIARRFEDGSAKPFLRAFPYGWLKLNDINFMAPDPDHFRHYHRKSVSDDMVEESLAFFRHAVDENVPVPEFLSADYSFVNADLADVYGLEDVPRDSVFRKYTFTDGRRGGLLGMGAFLTVTADSLSTSPIHRAVYVMENFLGIHPAPPPADVEIAEPDVREASTIKEILEKHRSDRTCASCHQRIDPFGYAFENFDPAGAWRDVYVKPASVEESAKPNPGRRPTTIPIDASASFRSGAEYDDIVGYREHLLNDANRDRFVRCFITKLLTYANGVAPDETDFVEVDAILARSAEHDYRLVDTIAAVVDSPLFREE